MMFGHICSPLLVDMGVNTDTFWSGHTFCCIVLGLILFYFIIQKQIAEMKISGILLFVGIIGFVLFLFIKLVTGKNKGTFVQENLWKFDARDITVHANMPTIFLAYVFQTAYLPVYDRLRDKNDRNGMKATTLAFAIVCPIYIILSIIAILSFGDLTNSDIMVNISGGERTGALDYILMGLFILISAMHIPINFFIGKDAVLIIIDEIM
jgi:amino acid permease